MKSLIETYHVASGTVRLVLEVDGRVEAPNWSRCGGWLMVNSAGLLYRIPLDNPRMERIDTGPATRCNNDHGFSPDGQVIYLSSHHEGRGAQIYRMPAAGGPLEKISPQPPSWWHGVSSDDKMLLYPAVRETSEALDIYTMLAPPHPTLSPEGRGRTTQSDAPPSPLGGEGRGEGAPQETRLTQGIGHSDGPDFSADGRRIYWNCDATGHAQIWVMNADGSDQRPLFRDDHVNWFPHPSPCGRHLVYLAYPPGTQSHPADLPVALVLCNPDGTDRRRIRAFIGGQGTMNVPNWSPDGSAFAYIRYAI
ncbi:TolB family protein [Fuscibacter oryzae]|uniref:PD40 domain-containing protein n=1 Tax=Fuscibacter oryzae TaxID=2803939 RepID=A0A8J7SVZ5_9RHOB|nr:PD40 domain-containing protein [Fuscibacter oryzae]MBL4929176.1 PD40 domain-containing protein [Fuscibacter oryzae]